MGMPLVCRIICRHNGRTSRTRTVGYTRAKLEYRANTGRTGPMQSTLRYVGLDVHKVSTVVAVAEGSGGEAQVWGKIGSDAAAVEGALGKLGGPGHVKAC